VIEGFGSISNLGSVQGVLCIHSIVASGGRLGHHVLCFVITRIDIKGVIEILAGAYLRAFIAGVVAIIVIAFQFEFFHYHTQCAVQLVWWCCFWVIIIAIVEHDVTRWEMRDADLVVGVTKKHQAVQVKVRFG